MSKDLGALRVLLVDDHPLVRVGLRTVLQRRFPGITIDEAGTAAEALTLAADAPPGLVLIDVNLPRINGLQLLRRIRARDKQIKTIVVAAEADPWVVNEALKAGADGFVSKSHSHEALEKAILVVVGNGSFLCPEAQAALEQREHLGHQLAVPGPGILSQRERQVLRLIARGENTKTIAALLRLSPKTVETHRQHITRKLGTSNAAALVRYAIRHGLTAP